MLRLNFLARDSQRGAAPPQFKNLGFKGEYVKKNTVPRGTFKH
ncbi:MAG: hypothetical protein ACI9IL_000655 [Rickettsiales bacterium]|jgi:hypothetical protein